MGISHRNGDRRLCGDVTLVTGQTFVRVNGQLWAVQNDQVGAGFGELIPTQTFVTINGLRVILAGDTAIPDIFCFIIDGAHCFPYAAGGDATVTVNG